MSDNIGHSVTYTVKEMLENLGKKIDRIDAKLDSKVDVAAFERIQHRVESAADRAAVLALEIKVNDLIHKVETQDRINEAVRVKSEETAKTSATNFTRKEKIVTVFVALAALALQLYIIVQGGVA